MNTREEQIKKSALNAKDSFDYRKLSYPAKGFLDSTFEEKTEDIMFTYTVDDKLPLSQLQKESTDSKFRFLINFAALLDAIKLYDVSLTEENVYYDENYVPYIMKRDIYAPGKEVDAVQFMEDYKCFVGGLLSKRYSVSQLQKSGLAILKKDARFQKVLQCQNAEALAEELRAMKKASADKLDRDKKMVSKTGYIVWRLVAVIAVVLLGASGAYTYNASQKVIPMQKAQIEANQSFIKKDYVACVDSMNLYNTEEMDAETKYILAYAYAISESFKKEEIETIISRLSVKSNEKELEYWINLGRLNVKKAQEIALSLSDDKLLIYAYMKEADLLESDTTVSGTKKKDRLDVLEKEIQSLGEKYQKAEEEANNQAEQQMQEPAAE